MRKFLMTILSVAMICCIAGCGNDKNTDTNNPNNDVTLSPTETPSDETPSDENVTPTPGESKETKVYEDEDFVLVQNVTSATVTLNSDKSWELGFYDENIIKFEINENKYVITPVAEGNTSVDIILNSDAQVIYYTVITVNADKTMNFSVEKIEVLGGDEPMMPEVDATLDGMMQNIYAKMPEDSFPPSVASRMVDITSADDMMYNLGVDTLTGATKAIVSEPMMSSIAFSIVIIEFDSNENAKAAASTLPETAPKAKWVCVEAEDVVAKVVKDNYVLFAMSNVDTVKAIDSIVVE